MKMTPEVKGAVCEWLSGLLIGLMPLAAHGSLHLFAKPAGEWQDSWAADILIISITNSGLSAVTVFTRLAKGSLKFATLSSESFVMMAITMIIFFLAGLLYGVVASGYSADNTASVAIVILISSGIVSLYFEMALAARMLSDAVLKVTA